MSKIFCYFLGEIPKIATCDADVNIVT